MKTTSIIMLTELKTQLEILSKTLMSKQVFVGFDGFVDKIKKAVKQRRNAKTVYFKSLHDFAERINAVTGKSGQIEMVTQKVKLGGNAPILANTFGKLGVKNFCLGSMGFPEKHSVFSAMHEKCELISVLNPGESDAIEFEDGKIIFSELGVFDQYDWKYIKEIVGLQKMCAAIQESALVAFVDWVNLPHASNIWEGVLDDIIKASGRKDFMFFFDLCDPSKKSVAEIDEILDLMSSFSSYGKVTVGLNENETLKIWCAVNGIDSNDPESKNKIVPVKEAGDFLYKIMDIDCLLVHPIDRTIVYHQRETLELHGMVVTDPKVLTGGGDNLNAGYCLGLLAGFTLPQCMLFGMAASGAYIKNGVTPDFNDILNYVSVWMEKLKVNSENPMHVFRSPA